MVDTTYQEGGFRAIQLRRGFIFVGWREEDRVKGVKNDSAVLRVSGKKISVRMAIITKSTNNECGRGCGEKRTLLHCWWESKLVESL